MNDDLPLETATSGAPQPPPRVEKGDTLANVLRRRIADDILSEKLRPGTRLDERSLARDFGVSRTPRFAKRCNNWSRQDWPPADPTPEQ